MRRGPRVVLASLVLGLAAAGVLALALRHGSARGARPNLLFIAVDTLRRDALGCYGSTQGATPTIDALAASSTRFTHTLSPSNVTSASFASLLTGTYLRTHGVLELSVRGYKLDPRTKTLAEYLRDASYETIGAVSAFHLDGPLSGLDRGFDCFLNADDSQTNQIASTTTSRVLDAVRTWKASPEGGKPLFLFVHYFDPHWPYVPPPPYDTKFWTGERPPRSVVYASMHETDPEKVKWRDFLCSQYTGEVAFVDHEIGRLFAGLSDFGLVDGAVVVFTADHGENLGEHGLYFNHGRMYREVTNVPMIVHEAGQTRGAVVDALAQGIDLLPTALDCLDVPLPRAGLEGKSLRPVLEGRETSVHDVIFSESQRIGEVVAQSAARKLAYQMQPHVHESESFELYDLAADPAEARDLVPSGEDFAALRTRLEALPPRCRFHLRFGAAGAARRFHAALRGVKSTIVAADPAGFESEDRAERLGDGTLVVDCRAGGGDTDEIVAEVDRAATLALSITVDGRPVAREDVAIGGRPFGQRSLTYWLEWNAAAEAMGRADVPANAAARLERDLDGTIERLRLDVGLPGGSEPVEARVFGARNLRDAEALTGKVAAEPGMRVRATFGASASPGRFRFALDGPPSWVCVSLRIGDRAIAPGELDVAFPIRLAAGIASVPLVTSAHSPLHWEDAPVPAGERAAIEARWETPCFAQRDDAAAEVAMKTYRERLRALGYLAGTDR